MVGRDAGKAIGDKAVCFDQHCGRLPRPYDIFVIMGGNQIQVNHKKVFDEKCPISVWLTEGKREDHCL